MKHLTDEAEDRIKQMDFCTLKGVEESSTDIDDLINTYLINCDNYDEKPSSVIEVELYKYLPFAEYHKGIIIEDLIERMDDYHKEEATELGELSDRVFELEKELYTEITKCYNRYWGDVFATIEINITDEIGKRNVSEEK